MSTRPKRPRAHQREKRRELTKLADKLDRLVHESAGGSPERAVEVSSASVIEVKARALRCGRCEGELLLVAHEAEFRNGVQLRRVDLQCRSCFAPRRAWFRLGPPPAN